MTKQQKNKYNYICIVVFAILEISAIVGAYAVSYFTKARMGMLRHVVYLNGKWEKMLPIQMIKWISVISIIVFMIFIYLRVRKKELQSLINTIVTLLTIIMSGWTLYFLLRYGAEINRAYYIMSICFILSTAFQNIIYHCFHSINKRNS